MDAKLTAIGLAGGRLLIGSGFVAVPGVAARGWIGAHSHDPGAKLMTRAAGGRDVAIALGTLATLRHKRQRRRWLEAGALADGTDLVATLAAGRSLPGRGLAFGILITTASTLVDLWLIRELG